MILMHCYAWDMQQRLSSSAESAAAAALSNGSWASFGGTQKCHTLVRVPMPQRVSPPTASCPALQNCSSCIWHQQHYVINIAACFSRRSSWARPARWSASSLQQHFSLPSRLCVIHCLLDIHQRVLGACVQKQSTFVAVLSSV